MSKIVQLVRSLISATNSKSLEWKSTADESVYQVSFPKYSVQLSKEETTQPNADGEDIAIKIFNAEGLQVDEIRDWHSELRTEMSQPYTTLKEFYLLVRGQVLGIEDAYDYLLSELNDLPF